MRDPIRQIKKEASEFIRISKEIKDDIVQDLKHPKRAVKEVEESLKDDIASLKKGVLKRLPGSKGYGDKKEIKEAFAKATDSNASVGEVVNALGKLKEAKKGKFYDALRKLVKQDRFYEGSFLSELLKGGKSLEYDLIWIATYACKNEVKDLRVQKLALMSDSALKLKGSSRDLILEAWVDFIADQFGDEKGDALKGEKFEENLTVLKQDGVNPCFLDKLKEFFAARKPDQSIKDYVVQQKKEHAALKEMGHVFSIANVNDAYKRLEGGSPKYQNQRINDSFGEFKAGDQAQGIVKDLGIENAKGFLNDVEKMMGTGLETIKDPSPKAIKRRIENKESFQVPLTIYGNDSEGESINHGVSLVFQEGKLFVCNRGWGADVSNPDYAASKWNDAVSMEIYDFDVKQFGDENLAKLLKPTPQTWKKLFGKNRHDFLGMSRIASGVKGAQSIGNCSWASTKTALIGCIMAKLNAANPGKYKLGTAEEVENTFDAALKLYKEWSLYDRQQRFDKYANRETASQDMVHKSAEKLLRVAVKRWQGADATDAQKQAFENLVQSMRNRNDPKLNEIVDRVLADKENTIRHSEDKILRRARARWGGVNATSEQKAKLEDLGKRIGIRRAEEPQEEIASSIDMIKFAVGGGVLQKTNNEKMSYRRNIASIMNRLNNLGMTFDERIKFLEDISPEGRQLDQEFVDLLCIHNLDLFKDLFVKYNSSSGKVDGDAANFMLFKGMKMPLNKPMFTAFNRIKKRIEDDKGFGGLSVSGYVDQVKKEMLAEWENKRQASSIIESAVSSSVFMFSNSSVTCTLGESLHTQWSHTPSLADMLNAGALKEGIEKRQLGDLTDAPLGPEFPRFPSPPNFPPPKPPTSNESVGSEGRHQKLESFVSKYKAFTDKYGANSNEAMKLKEQLVAVLNKEIKKESTSGSDREQYEMWLGEING